MYSKTCSAISSAGAGGGGRSRASRGSDLRYNMRVTLEEAYSGTRKTIRVPRLSECDSCNGSGAEGGAEPVTCPTCSGMGKVRAQQGFFTVETHLSNLWRRGTDREEPVQGLWRRGPYGERGEPVGQHPGRRRNRHPYPPVG